MKTFYEQLNLSRDASFEDIRTVIAQRREAFESGMPDGVRKGMLDRLKAAERVLLNPELRAKYDQELGFETSNSQTQPPALPPRLPSRLPPSLPPRPDTTVQDRPLHIPPLPVATERQTGPGHSPTCTTCGAKLSLDAKHCPVCGTEFEDTPSASPPGSTVSPSFSNPFVLPTRTPEQLEKFFRVIGWNYARGTIVSADQPYHVEKEFILSRFLLKTALFVFIAWVCYNWVLSELPLLLVIVIILVLLAFFLKGLLMVLFLPFQFLFAMMGFGKGKEKQVQVRDVRLRDEALHEYIVRFRGELRSGHVMVGDQIEIWGGDRGGTLMARWGYNFRTKSRIWVKYQ